MVKFHIIKPPTVNYREYGQFQIVKSQITKLQIIRCQITILFAKGCYCTQLVQSIIRPYIISARRVMDNIDVMLVILA